MARTYNFIELQKRKRDVLALSRKKDAIKAAKNLSTILSAYPEIYTWAVCDAILATGVHLRTVEDETIEGEPLIELEGYGSFLAPQQRIPIGAVGGGPAYSIRLARLLQRFATAVDEGHIIAQKGNFLHRFRYGPLYFSTGKEGRKGVEPDHGTCLAVFLSFLIRRFTADGPQRLRWFTGERVTQEGEPIFPLVEELVNDALECRIDRVVVEQFLRRHPDLKIWGYD